MYSDSFFQQKYFVKSVYFPQRFCQKNLTTCILIWNSHAWPNQFWCKKTSDGFSISAAVRKRIYMSYYVLKGSMVALFGTTDLCLSNHHSHLAINISEKWNFRYLENREIILIFNSYSHNCAESRE